MSTIRTRIAAAGVAAAFAAGLSLAAVPANAAALPTCATAYHCTTDVAAAGSLTEDGGVAGYYGADDNHTHYRYVATVVSASPELVDLSGAVASDLGALPSVGDELCDPNDGVTAQISLGYVSGKFQVSYEVGRYPANADPCIQNNFQTSGAIFKTGTLLLDNGISVNDQVFLGIYYDPSGKHFHQLSFGVIDATSGISRQAYANTHALNFWEFGIGAFTPVNVLTGGAVNKFETFSQNAVTCYSCTGAVPITSVSPVNPFGAGGLYEAQFANSSSQVVMSPDDSLTPASFTMYNGSTSI